MKIICSHIIHKNKDFIELKFEYNKSINQMLREFSFVKFSASRKAWILPKNKKQLQSVVDALKGKAIVDTSRLKLSSTHEEEIKIHHYTKLTNIINYNYHFISKP